MNDLAIARALHVVAVVLWIGGVGLVTTALLPALRGVTDPAQRLAMFEAVENRFGAQAKFTVLLAGASGLYMVVRLDLWDRFTSLPYWWMHAMVLVWLIFAMLLFVLEPLVLHRLFATRAKADPARTFRAIHHAHIVLLTLSVVTILGAVAGSQGMLLFD